MLMKPKNNPIELMTIPAVATDLFSLFFFPMILKIKPTEANTIPVNRRDRTSISESPNHPIPAMIPNHNPKQPNTSPTIAIATSTTPYFF